MNAPSGTLGMKVSFGTSLFIFLFSCSGWCTPAVQTGVRSGAAADRSSFSVLHVNRVALHSKITQSFAKRKNTRPSLAERNVRKLLLRDCRLEVTADYQSKTPKDTFFPLPAPLAWRLAVSVWRLHRGSFTCSLPSTCVFLRYSLDPILWLHGSFQLQRGAKDKLYVRAPV